MLLLTSVLVAVAAVTLLVGIFGNSLPFIIVSIGFSVVAAIALSVWSTLSKRRAAEAVAGAGVPIEEPTLADVAATVREAPVTAGATASSAAAGATVIDRYDSLRVNDILPKLEALDLDQLEALAQYEESNKNRASVLNRIDQLMDQLEAREAAQQPADVVGAGARAGSSFPIPGYDARSEDEIIGLLGDLDADELETVAEYEETHANRDRLLDAIDDRLDELEGLVPATSAATATKKAVKTAGSKKAGVKKIAVTKKAASKAATKTAAKAAKKAPAPVKGAAKKASAPTKTAKAASKATTKAPTKATTAKKAGAKKAKTTTR